MMKNIPFLLLLIGLIGCQSTKKNLSSEPNFKLEIIYTAEELNVRAMEIDGNQLFIATSKGEILKSSLTNDFQLISQKLVDAPKEFPLNFRALAVVNHQPLALTIGSPALLFHDGKIVYEEVHEKAFYDAMTFWNEKEGIAMGDPTDDCLSILITRDGGQNWRKISCEQLPKVIAGEAAFAASDTNITTKGNHAWIASGGMQSRVFHTKDKGKTWTVLEAPIIQGTPTTGIYSIDFYDEKNGFAIGGDYTQPKKDSANKIITTDGGQTWQLIGSDQPPGYRSCVQYFPNSKAKKLLAVGFEGIDFSMDGGKTWKHLSDEGFYTLRFFNESIAYLAGNGKIAKLTFY